MSPFYIALTVSASGLMILILRSLYCLAAGTGQAKKEYGALLKSGLMGETEEIGPPQEKTLLSAKLRSAMDEAKARENSAADPPDPATAADPEPPEAAEARESGRPDPFGPQTGPLPPREAEKPYVFKGRGRPSEGFAASGDGPETRELRL